MHMQGIGRLVTTALALALLGGWIAATNGPLALASPSEVPHSDVFGTTWYVKETRSCIRDTLSADEGTWTRVDAQTWTGRYSEADDIGIAFYQNPTFSISGDEDSVTVTRFSEGQVAATYLGRGTNVSGETIGRFDIGLGVGYEGGWARTGSTCRDDWWAMVIGRSPEPFGPPPGGGDPPPPPPPDGGDPPPPPPPPDGGEPPAAGPGRIHVFSRGVMSDLQYASYESGWSDWESLGGQVQPRTDAASWGPGRIDLVSRGFDNTLQHKYYDNGGWSEWESLGGELFSHPSVTSWGPGHLDVFALGSNGALLHKHYENGWSDWESLGGTYLSGPDAASWGPGRLDVFALGADSSLQHVHYENGWSGPEPLGGSFSSDPSAVSWGPGRLDVFARDSAGEIAHRAYENGGWADWESLGGDLISGPGATAWGTGRLFVFASLQQDNSVWMRRFDGGWSDWVSIGGYAGGDPSATSWGSGTAEAVLETPPADEPLAGGSGQLVNGDFETPDAGAGYLTYGAGSSFDGWTVEAGSVDLVGLLWVAANGSQSIDLGGNEPGTLSQELATVPGQSYRLRFALAGNWYSGDPVKRVEVRWGDTLVDTATFDSTGRSNADMGWEYREYVVTASGLSTRLTFVNLTAGPYGPTLDDVSIVEN